MIDVGGNVFPMKIRSFSFNQIFQKNSPSNEIPNFLSMSTKPGPPVPAQITHASREGIKAKRLPKGVPNSVSIWILE